MMPSCRKALVCAPVVPEYDRESGSRRIFHLIELLRDEGWWVTFVSEHGRGVEDERYLKALRQRGVMAVAGMDSSLEPLLDAGRFDLAIFAFWYLAEQCIPLVRKVSPRTRILVDSVDLHFLREARQVFNNLTPKPESFQPSGETYDDGAVLTAEPNPVPEVFGPGRTRISWNVGNGQPGCVCVAVNGAPEKVFCESPSGARDADWIAEGTSYEFRLYSDSHREKLLARVSVAMDTASDHLGPTYAARMMREINAYAQADGVLTVSQKEADLINDLIADPGLAHAVPDYDEFEAAGIPMRRRKGILFVGNFKHAPNLAAVEHLCREIVPRLDPGVLAEHPIYIVGNALDERVLKFQAENVRMIGWVPSVFPYLERTRISIVPLTYGAGTKRKLLQALLVGSPAVSTSVGTEGLGLTHGEHVLVADEPGAFADSITRLLKDAGLWRKLARRGRAHALALQGRATVRERLVDTLRSLSCRLPKGATLPPTTPMARKVARSDYRSLIGRIREAVQETLPGQSTVLVVTKGDAELLQLNGRRAWHFPRDDAGEYAGHHPADSHEAIAHLEALRGQGAEFFLLPQTSFWWQDHYSGFKQHLERHYREIFRQDDACVIFSLRDPVLESKPASNVQAECDEPVGQEAVTSPTASARLIAFYLPQFYPTPENDAWWGAGFTEWTNVTKARPLFDGHDQPRLPGSLGFYDLRVPEVRQAQADLARKHGFEAFCYWHYWFHGKRLLARPFDEVLRTGEPDFPFCLSWANETWTRRWHGSGGDQQILQEQTYSEPDDVAHARWLTAAFADRRYLRVNGRPVFLIYRGADLPDARRTTDILRAECNQAGLPDPYLIGINSHKDLDYRTLGFDVTLDFEPQLGVLPDYAGEGLKIYDYVEARRRMTSRKRDFPVHPCIFVRWDNTSRRGKNGIVFTNATPTHFQTGLAEMVRAVQSQPPEERLVFVNAWNEWAEGNHLEPDSAFGNAYLEATVTALKTAGCRNLNS